MKLHADGILYCQKLSSNYSTIISCTKVSRSIGTLNQNGEKKTLFGSVDVEILEKSMVHQSFK